MNFLEKQEIHFNRLVKISIENLGIIHILIEFSQIFNRNHENPDFYEIFLCGVECL